MIVCGFVTAIKRPVVDVEILMSVCSFKDDVKLILVISVTGSCSFSNVASKNLSALSVQ